MTAIIISDSAFSFIFIKFSAIWWENQVVCYSINFDIFFKEIVFSSEVTPKWGFIDGYSNIVTNEWWKKQVVQLDLMKTIVNENFMGRKYFHEMRHNWILTCSVKHLNDEENATLLTADR